jgi:hypothetical protein
MIDARVAGGNPVTLTRAVDRPCNYRGHVPLIEFEFVERRIGFVMFERAALSFAGKCGEHLRCSEFTVDLPVKG